MTQRRIYQNTYPYHLTTVTKNRRWAFRDVKLAWKLHQAILGACFVKGYTALAFCILPDHIHLLVWKHIPARVGEPTLGLDEIQTQLLFPEAQRAFSNVRDNNHDDISYLMKSIKGTFARSISSGPIWQPSFNSRIVDSDQRLYNTLQYIQYNYRKHKLPAHYGQAPYTFLNIPKSIYNIDQNRFFSYDGRD
ncbi:MAG: transposase [Candidatus Nomurabacteria bacterium]|nr:MAG: transposase [Candidatus Nomurabacteria bacterium]